ncbi:uncharacterized protein si:dkey-192k22.2 [Colossoma macropomum]|uniref:uncharacterized protein si:dkey-192k22.2 n=1 Tax=Colossoma macropomum TaxID=42526 RepID=UPI001863E27C|nr:uncharacterized protein si:dkey-192k22.2 [Colossoma macropomum]
MSKATAAKLAVLVFLTFIICLPEFFPSDTDPVLQIPFNCLSFNPCDPMSGQGPKDGQICQEYRNTSRINALCEVETKENMISQDKVVQDWFVCETEADLWSLHDNASLSDLDTVLMLQVTNQTLQNVTMHGHFNQSGLHIDTSLNFTLLGCCAQPQRDCAYPNKVKASPTSHKPVTRPGLSTVPSSGETDSTSNLKCQSNRSQCFFRYVGGNAIKASTKEVRWWGFSIAVWMILVLIVIVVVMLSVWVQVCTSRRCFHAQSAPVRVAAHRPKSFSKRRVKSLGDLPDISIPVWSAEDEELFLEKTPKDYSRGLSPIFEVSLTGMSA